MHLSLINFRHTIRFRIIIRLVKSNLNYTQPMTEQIEQHIIKKYEIIKKVGSGAYGHVWRVKDRKSGEVMALKKIFDAFQHSTDAQRTYREIMFLRQFNHPNIIKLHHVLKAENDKDIYLVFEFMEADLHNAIRQKILQDLHLQYVIYQCVLSLRYLHSGDVIHRDLKPSNVLLNSSCKVKLCDFGLVRSIAKDDRSSPVLTQYVATRWYRAPQILLGSNEYTKAVDLWSLGCIIAQMTMGKPIFPGNSTLHQLEKILSFTGKPTKEDVDSVRSQLAKTMIDSISSVKYKAPVQWFPQSVPDLVDLITKLLQFNPTKRLSCDQMLQHPYIRHFHGKDPESELEAPHVFQVDKDQQKLTTKDYRNLIYDALRQDKYVQRQSVLPPKEDSKQSTFKEGNLSGQKEKHSYSRDGQPEGVYSQTHTYSFASKDGRQNASPTYKDNKKTSYLKEGVASTYKNLAPKQAYPAFDQVSAKDPYPLVKDSSTFKGQKLTRTKNQMFATESSSKNIISEGYTASSALKTKIERDSSHQAQNLKSSFTATRSGQKPSSFAKRIQSPPASHNLADKYSKIQEDNKQKNISEEKFIKPSTLYNKQQTLSPKYVKKQLSLLDAASTGTNYYSPKVGYQKTQYPIKSTSPPYKYVFSSEKKEGLPNGLGPASSAGFSPAGNCFAGTLQRFKRSGATGKQS